VASMLASWPSIQPSIADDRSREISPISSIAETSSARSVSGLNLMTRNGSQCWPDIKSAMVVSRSARSRSVSANAVPNQAVVVDHDVIIFGRSRNNRGPITHTQLLPNGWRLPRPGRVLAWRACCGGLWNECQHSELFCGPEDRTIVMETTTAPASAPKRPGRLFQGYARG
jgi:hypothetical protein